MEQIDQLEQRVERLLQALEHSRRHNQRIEEENERLGRRLEELDQMRQQNEQLQTQVRELENELEAHAGRDSQVRDRLRQILGKIDSLESEIVGSGEMKGS